MIPASIASEETPAVPPPLRRRMRVGAVVGVLLGALAAVGGVYYWNQRGLPELPGTDRATRTARDAGGAAVAGREPRVAGGGAAARAESVVSNAGDSATAGAAESAGVGTVAESTPTGARTETSIRAEAESPAGPAPASNDPQVQQFDALADSLDHAIRNFGDRAQDFALQRLTCRGLAFGYRSTDDAFIALANRYRGVRDALDPVRAARYRSLVGQMEQVNATFDQSRCPRP
jgi:hypothetical protein